MQKSCKKEKSQILFEKKDFTNFLEKNVIPSTTKSNKDTQNTLKNKVSYSDWKNDFQNAIDSDFDYSIQWSFIGIDTNTTNRKANFGNDNTSIYKNQKGKYKVKVHNSSDGALSPYNYACQYLGYSISFQDFICECFNLPKYDDLFSSNTNTTKTKKIVCKPFKRLKKKASHSDSQIVSFEVETSKVFSSNILHYLANKASIHTKHLVENNVFQIEKATKTYSNSYVSVMESDLLFGVRLENSECYKIIDKANKKVNWFPTLSYAKENELLPNDYSYSLGIDTFIDSQDFAYLVGGEMDFAALKTYGFQNVFTVGNETSNINPYVLQNLKNKGIKTVFVIYDTDFTGVQNSNKLHNKELNGITFKRVELPKLQKQLFRYNKEKQVFEYAYTSNTFKQVSTNSISSKPTLNDICDYIGAYGFDTELKEVLSNYSEPITESKSPIDYAYTYSIDRYIDTTLLTEKGVFDAIETKKTVLVHSSTGTGKSTAALQMAKFFSHFLGKKIIFAAPRNVIASQNAKKENKLLFVGNTFDDNIELFLNDLLNNDILYCNYDNLERLIAFLKLKGIDFYTIIDEPHLLPSDATYRKKVVKSVFRVIENENTLLLTATPKKLYFDTYNIKINAINKKPYAPSKVYVGAGKKAIQKAINIITDSIQNDRNILLMVNSMKTIRVLQNALKAYQIESYVFSSKGLTESEKTEYNEFLDKGTFEWKATDKKRVILGTCCIATGVNIESEKDIDTIYFNKHIGFDNVENAQFKARIRNYESINVYNHIITPSLNEKEKYYEFDFEKTVQRAQRYCDFFNTEYQNESDTYERSKIKLECTKLVQFNDLEQRFEVDNTEIQIMYEKHLIENGSPLFDNPISIEILENEVSENTKESCNVVQELQNEIETSIVTIATNDFKALCKAVHNQTKDISYLQSECFKQVKNEQIENEIVLSSSELSAAEKFLKRFFPLLKIAPFKKVINALIVENKETNQLEFAKTSTYFANKTNLELDFLLSIPKPTSLEKTEIRLLENRISKIERSTSKPISLKDLHKEVNKRTAKEFQISIQYLSVLIDRCFDCETIRDSSRKTVLILTKKQD